MDCRDRHPQASPCWMPKDEEDLVTDYTNLDGAAAPCNILFLRIEQGSHHLWFWDVSCTPGQ